MKRLLVTGSSGLVGSEVVAQFCSLGWAVHGVDNNMRARFFGPGGDTLWNRERLRGAHAAFQSHDIDIRDRQRLTDLVASLKPDLVVHAAAQPSHDLAASIPVDDFEINALATLNLLEAVRRHVRDAPFVFMSSNKTYGDRPNSIRLVELDTRWDYDDPRFADGIAEDFPVDQTMHSLFGASKLAADVLVQEYGRYFGMMTCCLRAGCVSGPQHSGVELHGFLSYLVKCNAEQRVYTIFGYKGKQVRDIIHAADIARFIRLFSESPRSGEVYNIGGGRANSLSVREALSRVEAISGLRSLQEYSDRHRKGDHTCYISNLTKIKAHYPSWRVSRGIDAMIEEIYSACAASHSATTA